MGGSASLEDWAKRGYLDSCERILAVDGAARLALEYGLTPDIVVGDADGGFTPIIASSKLGAVVVLHAHGDNLWAVSYLVPILESFTITVQCNPYPPYTWVIPGFTDGERALGLALLCGVSRLRVYGMNIDEPIGWWSKPWLKSPVRPWDEKKLKLMIASIVFEAFRRLASIRGIELEWL